jgi:Ca-activated chloride channel family protein
MKIFSEFHFLRPLWLLALFPLVLMLWWLWRRHVSSLSWQRVVDARLMPYVMIDQPGKKNSRFLFLTGVSGLLAITAMAGPAWQKLNVPVFRQTSARILVLDLSNSMNAQDVVPSRIERAKMKLRDILQQPGDTALIVYAATPYVVSPLTFDAKTIASQLASLSTDLMPAQGSRPDRALHLALQLLKQSSARHAQVLLITDGIDESPETHDAVKALVDAGHTLSVLGVGSVEGAPIPSVNGSFIKDEHGAIVIPKLNDAALAELAHQGNGFYRHISTDDSDIAALQNGMNLSSGKKVEGLNSDQWRDEGPWLLLPLILLTSLIFRRGVLLILLAGVVFWVPQPVFALDWQQYFQNDDQLALRALQANQPQQAAKRFKNPQWRAAANYRAGNYPAAAQDLQHIDTTDAAYNLGNALAKQGKFAEAISAYQAALKLNANNKDAAFNRDLVEKMQKQQQKQDKQDKQDKSRSEQDKQQDGQPDDKNQSGKSSGKDQATSQQDKTGKKPEESTPSNKSDEKQQANDKEAKSRQAEEQQAGKPSDKQAGRESISPGKQLPAIDQQWLQRIPDDPGGLWRRKFLYQYKQQPVQSEDKAW